MLALLFTPLFFIVAVCNAATNLEPFQFVSESDIGSVKVLGRAIRNKETQEILQLACVGDPRIGDLDASCSLVRFIYTAVDKPARFIGQAFTLKELEKGRDELNKKSVRKELKKKLVEFQNNQGLRADVSVLEEWFPATSTQSVGAFVGFGLGASAIVGFCAWALTALTGPIAIACPIFMGLAILVAVYPVIEDLLLLPMRVVVRSLYEKGFVEDYKNMQELGNRNLQFWQERSKQVSASGFRRLFLGFGESDQIVFETARSRCQVNTRFNISEYWRQDQVRSNSGGGTYSAPESFLRKYSNTIMGRSFGFQDAKVTEKRQSFDSAEKVFEDIVLAQVRKNYYLDQTPSEFNLVLRPSVYVREWDIYSDQYQKSKRYCFGYYLYKESGKKIESKVFAKGRVCDRSAIVALSKLSLALPSCKKISRWAGVEN